MKIDQKMKEKWPFFVFFGPFFFMFYGDFKIKNVENDLLIGAWKETYHLSVSSIIGPYNLNHQTGITFEVGFLSLADGQLQFFTWNLGN